jgi:hypothetical protein
MTDRTPHPDGSGRDAAPRSSVPRWRARLERTVGWGLVLVAALFVVGGFLLVLRMLLLWSSLGAPVD